MADVNDPGVGEIRIAVGTLALTTGALVVVLWALGLFDFSGTEASAKVVGSTIALVGILFTGWVTFLGLYVKRSLDARTLALQREAEKRLKLDTAIRAMELIKSASGEASPSEIAGALFGLTTLGELDFALRLLEDLWPRERVESPSAVWVVNRALQSSSGSIQELAATILRKNSHQLPDDNGGMIWPTSMENEWNAELSPVAQDQILEALVRGLLSREFTYWAEPDRNGILVFLLGARETSRVPRIRKGATVVLRELLRTYPTGQLIAAPHGRIEIDDLRSPIEGDSRTAIEGTAHEIRHLVEDLGHWVGAPPRS